MCINAFRKPVRNGRPVAPASAPYSFVAGGPVLLPFQFITAGRHLLPLPETPPYKSAKRRCAKATSPAVHWRRPRDKQIAVDHGSQCPAGSPKQLRDFSTLASGLPMREAVLESFCAQALSASENSKLGGMGGERRKTDRSVSTSTTETLVSQLQGQSVNLSIVKLVTYTSSDTIVQV